MPAKILRTILGMPFVLITLAIYWLIITPLIVIPAAILMVVASIMVKVFDKCPTPYQFIKKVWK